MEYRNCLSTLAIVASLVLAACSSEDYTDDPIFDEEIKTELVDKSQLPEWLADYVTYLEYVPEGQPLPTEPSGFYRFEWNGKTYYEYYSPSQNAMHTEIYTSEGEPYLLKENDYKAFSEEVRNWTIVYVLKPSHEMTNWVYPLNTDSLRSFFQRSFNDFRSDYQGFIFQWDNTPTECYVINSQKQLESIYIGSDHLPFIDFKNNSLILGKIRIQGNYSLKKQYYYEGQSICPKLRLFFEKQDLQNHTLQSDDVVDQYFWGIYPKIVQDNNFLVTVIVDNQFSGATEYTWDSSAILEEPEISDTTDWNIQIDENGGISFICLQCGDNSLEKLYSCPSGIDDVKFLLPLSDGNEIRRISQGMISHDEVYNFIEFYERYQQYYKGVPVLNDGRLYYLLTPKGKRMTSGWFSWFFDIKDLDVSPNITKDQAMDIVSEYTGIPINEYWDCEDLTIREFNSKPHLIYIICFPHIGPITSPVLGITAPTDIAYIDAHSGEILYTNYIKTSD